MQEEFFLNLRFVYILDITSRALETNMAKSNTFNVVALEQRRYQFEDGTYRDSWDVVGKPRAGFALRITSEVGYKLYSEEADGSPFMPGIEIDPTHYEKHWKDKQAWYQERLTSPRACLLETIRSTRDTLLCNVLTRWDSMFARRNPDVVVGSRAWTYEMSYYDICRDRQSGNRSYMTMDGVSVWEVEEVRPPIEDGLPITVQLVRRTSLPILGMDSVLLHDGLNFIMEESRRNEHENAIRRIETSMIDGLQSSIPECAKVAEALLYQIASQRLKTNQSFGDFKVKAKLAKGNFKPLIDGFECVLSDAGLAKDEMKWVPGALLAIRGWGETLRHEGKHDRHLLPPDGMTAVFTYAALRDFVRLCQHIHKSNPEVLNPKTVNEDKPKDVATSS